MNINDLTLGQIRELQSITIGASAQHPSNSPSNSPSNYPVGRNVMVRTVTMIYTGFLLEVTATDLVLIDCSWIPETARFMQFVADGLVAKCEPYPEGLPVYINRGALLDMCEWKTDLPRYQK